MGGSNSLSVKKDFLGNIKIDSKIFYCYLYQVGGLLTLTGNEIEKVIFKKIEEALASEKLDVDFSEWELSKKETGHVVFKKK